MTSPTHSRTTPSTYRIDLPDCRQAGLGTPPSDVHLRVLPAAPDGGGWTLLAHSAPGKPEVLARWLAKQVALTDVRIAAGLAPKLFRAALPVLPRVWAEVASFVKVHQLDLAADGRAAWFVAGTRNEVWALAQHFQERTASRSRQRPVRYRPVAGPNGAAITRRQFEALATAVAMGYYEIPHRIDLRALAAASGVSLGSVSELLRRAEGAILAHYVDTNLMRWPLGDDESGSFRALAEQAALVSRPWDPSVRLVPQQRFEPPTTTRRARPPRGPPR